MIDTSIVIQLDKEIKGVEIAYKVSFIDDDNGCIRDRYGQASTNWELSRR